MINQRFAALPPHRKIAMIWRPNEAYQTSTSGSVGLRASIISSQLARASRIWAQAALQTSYWVDGTWVESLRCTPVSTSRSEEHTSELQSPCNLVCRLLLEKKKKLKYL